MVINCAAYTRVDQAESEAGVVPGGQCHGGRAPGRRPAAGWTARWSRSAPIMCSAASGRRPAASGDGPAVAAGRLRRTKLEGELAAADMPEAPHRADLRPLRPAVARSGARISSRRSCAWPSRPTRCGWWTISTARPATCRTWPGRSLFLLGGRRRARPAPWGIYHVTNRGATTWYEFACEIVRLAGLKVPVEPITTAEYAAAAPAARPTACLDTTAYHRLGGPAMPDWKTALAEYFAERQRLGD